MRVNATLLLLLAATTSMADDSSLETGGHTKLRLTGQSFDDNSVFSDVAGSTAVDAAGELRLNFSTRRQGWSVHADYQLIAAHSEFLPAGLPTDEQRLFDLTHTIHDGGEEAAVHRLDRLWAGYTGDKAVVRLGRQALTWGNGLFFTPMDLVNPFDPTTVDTEYKTGDDMLYLQYLLDNGDDVQAAIVFRRSPLDGDVDADEATVALKYHGFLGENEYDLLIAEDHDNTVVGLGGTRSVGGAILRGDLVVTDSDGDTRAELVSNLSYSWIWAGRNVSGAAEYYFDGDEDHYLAGSLMIEISPLWTLTPTVVANATDGSALFQLVTQHSLSDNMSLLGSLNVPLGPDGTRYGGPESAVPNRYLSFELGVFAQLAWYF